MNPLQKDLTSTFSTYCSAQILSKCTDTQIKILEDIRTFTVLIDSAKEYCSNQEQSNEEEHIYLLYHPEMVPKDVECRNIGRMTYHAPRYRGVQTAEF